MAKIYQDKEQNMNFDGPIFGKNIYLATLTDNTNYERYFSWLRDEDVTRFLEIKHDLPKSSDDIRRYVKNINSSDNNLLLGIFTNSEDLHIGNIKLGQIDWIHRRSEIGILIGDKTAWGYGFATEAIKLISLYAFQTLNLIKLSAGCYVENLGSAGAFRKAGFSLEATLISHLFFEGRRVDKLVFSLITNKV